MIDDWRLTTKRNALQVLEPFGFIDNDDGEFPGTIFHDKTGLVIDTYSVPMARLIEHVYQLGKDDGRAGKLAEIRKALGIGIVLP